MAAAYDEIAEWYDAWAGPAMPEDHYYTRALHELVGDVVGQRVCDLACGQGRTSRYLAGLGAKVVGVDISDKLLDIARGYAEPAADIEYVHDDAQQLSRLADASFDGVACFMGLMDIPDLEATVGSVARVLRPGGWFAVAILHPCFNTAPSDEVQLEGGWMRRVSQYFTEGYWRRPDLRSGPPGKVGSYHRTLSTYLKVLLAAGFTLTNMVEPQSPPTESRQSRPIWTEVPALLGLRLAKPAG